MNETNKKRILLVSHEMTYTGAPRSLLNMSIALRDLGYHINIWTLNSGEFQVEFYKAGFEVVVITENIENYEKELAKMNLVILNTIFCASLISFFQNKIRTILYLREAQNIPNLILDCHLDSNNIFAAKEIICVSEYAKEFIEKKYAPENITVVHNYVADEYKPSLNCTNNNIIHYLVSGTIEYRKGQDIVLNAFANMPDELKKHTRLHVVGRKPTWSQYFWQNMDFRSDVRIIDHGEISDEKTRLQLYKKMNVFIIASRDESCSLVALEGAMLGKALILSENTGAKYLDLKQQYIYPTENPGELCRKMCELTSRKKLLLQGHKMRQAYLKTSTKEQFMASLDEIIRSEK